MEQEAKTQEELDKHFYRCYTEFPYYAKYNLKIKTKEGTLTAFSLNEVQLLLEEIEADMVARGRLIRYYTLKARQFGVSTKVTGKFFWKVSNNKSKSAVIITHEPPATRNLFDMQKRYYKNLEPEFKPASKYNNVKVLQFDTNDETGLDSSIGVATAGVKDFGSSQTIHYLHISELAKWPRENEGDLLTSLFQCVPDEPDTAIVIESTAKGVSGEFYKGYWSSRYQYEVYLDSGVAKWKVKINKDADPANVFSSVFIPWYVFKKYRMEPPKDFERTAEESLMAAKYGLSDAQLYWYRYVLANKCKGNKATRDQEYPTTAKVAFLSSGRPAFPLERLMELKGKCPEPTITYDYNHAKRKLIENKDGAIQVWQQPQVGAAYLISADVAEGLEHGDFDSATVWNHMTGIEVAHFHAHMSPIKFAYLLDFLGRMYNSAWIVPERNNHGITVVEKLLELDYPNLYVEMVEEPPRKPRRRFGWVTSTKTRPLIVDHLIDDVVEGVSGIKSKETFDEMMNFKTQANGKVEADEGEFDDRVLDCAIGRYTMKTLSYVVSFKHHFAQPVVGSSNPIGALAQQKPPVSAWN